MDDLLSVVRNTLSYDPESGVFRWVKPPASWIPTGAVAGSLHKATGYRYIAIAKKKYKAHRIAWLWMNGVMPAVAIDHINGDRDDNRISNLRLATYAENQQNRGPHSRNTSGYPGVSRDELLQKWRAKICVGRKQIHLGVFENIEDAARAYREAKARYHTFQPELRQEAP